MTSLQTPDWRHSIVVASDHAGFELKRHVIGLLQGRGLSVDDLGAAEGVKSDYADLAHALCGRVVGDPRLQGILICGSGIGVSIAANRHCGIRAALCREIESARLSREHNDSNVLCLSGRSTAPQLASQIVETWLDAPFEGGRHVPRIAKIELDSRGAIGTTMRNVVVFGHPLIQHKLTVLRDRDCLTKVFRETVNEIASLMTYEITRDIPSEDRTVMTPMGIEAKGKHVRGDCIAVIPILRAGLGMLNGILSVVPMAAVGTIGLYRDHNTLQPVEYYTKLPENMEERTAIVVDPMLATGGSAVAAVDVVKKRGARSIKFKCLLAAPEGIEKLSNAHPDVQIYCAGVDERLNDVGYILPGLGDAGDRLFGTK